MTGILGYGAYVPRRRLQRRAIHEANKWFAPGLAGLARGERAMAGWDEDSITMAVEAARDCLGGGRIALDALSLASTTPPFADRQNAGVVKEALGLPDAICTIDVGGSAKSGTDALLQALRGEGTTLCLAAEKRKSLPASESEMVCGDGAAAILVGEGEPIARFLGWHAVSADFVDHFRGAGAETDYAWENRWVRDEGYSGLLASALAEALTKFGIDGARIDHLILPIAAKGVPDLLARGANIKASAVRDGHSATIGHTGAAHPLLMLADTLAVAVPGDLVLLVGFGQGADILLFEVTETISQIRPKRGVQGWLERREPETNYLKFLAFNGQLNLDRGMRAEFDQKQPLTALFRHRRAVLGLIGTRCIATGAVQFPPSALPVGPGTTGPLEPYRLADLPAKVLTFTADTLCYSPDPPAWYGMIEFTGGGRMSCEFTDVDPETMGVGQAVRMMFRIKAVDDRRSFTKYFWKAAPAT